MSDDRPKLLEAVDLTVSYRQQNTWQRVVDGVRFSIRRGEVLGLVGESGCGKSTVALQLLGYRHPASRVERGMVRFKGKDLLRLERSDLVRLRGDRISFVPQNPTTALNPGIRIGAQVVEVLRHHNRADSKRAAFTRTAELFRLVGLTETPDALSRYPYQLSGGQQQRVCIAMALACEPDLVVLDEPTTGLDVTTQEQIVELLIGLRERFGMSMLYVTHDLGVLSQIADRIGVMYAGQMVELAPTAILFDQPRHPYTQGLIASIPRLDHQTGASYKALRGLLRRNDLPPGCPFEPRCDFASPSCARQAQVLSQAAPDHEVACQRWRDVAGLPPVAGNLGTVRSVPGSARVLLALRRCTMSYGTTPRWLSAFGRTGKPVAVDDLTFAIQSGTTFALVGESGSGKTTVARAISGLLAPQSGEIVLEGRPLPRLIGFRSVEQRRRIQYVFQNPDASLNPRMRIENILARPLKVYFDLDARSIREKVACGLADMRLDFDYARRFPDELSGGERQRVAIARALISKPDLLLCDEVLSGLDVSVQASVLDLLKSVRSHHQVALLFISHDLAVVRQLADRVGVLYRGRLMEIGNTSDVFTPPFHPYTYALLQAVPGQKQARNKRVKPRPVAREAFGAAGCAFAGRCPWQPDNICENVPPPWRESGGLAIRCHLSLAELKERAEEYLAPDRRVS